MSDTAPPVTAAKHKELTKKEAEALVKQAFDMERKIKDAAVRVHEAWWELSEQLYYFHEAGLWAALGYGSLDEFLQQPDLGLSRSQFFKMTKTWRDLVVVKQLPPSDLKELEPSKVREVVPAIMRGEVKPEDALDDAKVLSHRDVVEKYRADSKQRDPNDSKPLAAEDEPLRKRCSECGQYYVPDEEEEVEGELVDG